MPGGLKAGIAALALVAGLALAAGSPTEVSAAPPCTHQLTNGDPLSVDGALSLDVDTMGWFGSDGATGGAFFNPPGPKARASAVRGSGVFLSTASDFLEENCDAQLMRVVEASSSRVVTESIEPVGGLSIRLTQELGAVSSGTSLLTQTYELANTGATPLPFVLVRHLDGDLEFDGSISDLARATPDGSSLAHLDPGEAVATAGSLVAIAGSLDGDTTPERWTMQPYDYKPTILTGGIGLAQSGVVFSDGPFDASASQQWSELLGPDETATYTTTTQFGANRAPTVVSDLLLTDRDVAGNLNVLANDFDPDGDALQVVSGSPAAAHGTVSCAPGGLCTYTPAAGYVGADAFTYVVSDGRGGTAVGAVSVSVASTPPPVVGATVTVEPVQGTVLVRLPGTDRFIPLSDLASIPVGSTVDVTTGTVRLTQARPEGTRESAEFYEGVFTILQSRAAEAVAVLRLEGGDFSECGGTSAYFAEKPKRKLWGAGKGKFRTRGRFSAATVRGTTWYTADACDGTLTRVTEGSVTITDFVRGVDVVIGAGQSYLATPARRGLAGRACTITGTTGRDTLRGTRNRDVLCGLGGNDRLLGVGGGDLLLGGAGRDVLLGGDGRDELSGGAGNDRLDGGSDLDVLDGGSGNDNLQGGPGDDVLAGGSGSDYLAGGRGRDRLDGGGGSDFLIAKDSARGNDSVVGGPGRDLCRTDYVKICP